jgi:hypothetical protein
MLLALNLSDCRVFSFRLWDARIHQLFNESCVRRSLLCTRFLSGFVVAVNFLAVARIPRFFQRLIFGCVNTHGFSHPVIFLHFWQITAQ